jgi:hypothetical protein
MEEDPRERDTWRMFWVRENYRTMGIIGWIIIIVIITIVHVCCMFFVITFLPFVCVYVCAVCVTGHWAVYSALEWTGTELNWITVTTKYISLKKVNCELLSLPYYTEETYYITAQFQETETENLISYRWGRWRKHQ